MRCSFDGHTTTAEGPRKRTAQTAAAAKVLELVKEEAGKTSSAPAWIEKPRAWSFEDGEEVG